MIRVRLDNQAQVLAALEARGVALRREVHAGTGKLAIRLQQMVRAEKLSGQVLHRRSGQLAASITVTTADDAKLAIGTVSTNLFYGVGWELGWPGRKSLAAAKGKFSLAGADSFKNGTPKKRSFLGTALRDLAKSGVVRAEMEAAIARALEGSGA